MYAFLFFVKYFPFWALPLALVVYEIGQYYYNRRDRALYVSAFGFSVLMVLLSLVWLATEGFWRAAPFLKKYLFFA